MAVADGTDFENVARGPSRRLLIWDYTPVVVQTLGAGRTPPRDCSACAGTRSTRVQGHSSSLVTKLGGRGLQEAWERAAPEKTKGSFTKSSALHRAMPLVHPCLSPGWTLHRPDRPEENTNKACTVGVPRGCPGTSGVPKSTPQKPFLISDPFGPTSVACVTCTKCVICWLGARNRSGGWAGAGPGAGRSRGLSFCATWALHGASGRSILVLYANT